MSEEGGVGWPVGRRGFQPGREQIARHGPGHARQVCRAGGHGLRRNRDDPGAGPGAERGILRAIAAVMAGAGPVVAVMGHGPILLRSLIHDGPVQGHLSRMCRGQARRDGQAKDRQQGEDAAQHGGKIGARIAPVYAGPSTTPRAISAFAQAQAWAHRRATTLRLASQLRTAHFGPSTRQNAEPPLLSKLPLLHGAASALCTNFGAVS
ncbi:hypothetical protein SDC9_46115 [bioreactor metagenome]|uniref:Uncharacterized protein n=1 Tax=bioreactor metagenome TaxID=1076179 RepID=A0A644W7U1_9ZZZZ